MGAADIIGGSAEMLGVIICNNCLLKNEKVIVVELNPFPVGVH